MQIRSTATAPLYQFCEACGREFPIVDLVVFTDDEGDPIYVCEDCDRAAADEAREALGLASPARPARLPAQFVRVNTREYARSHGKPPRGRGLWAFRVEVDGAGGTRTYERMVSGSYGEAKRIVVAEARDRHPDASGVYIYALP
ncbi:MAG TPA: hypothetical protein VK052_06595 [Zeimonas sp.]|nr:hypothetical protein [Zeimonas sp.]